MSALDLIRCEKLAVAGFAIEATAVSETRVAIDRLERAWNGFNYDDIRSANTLEKAIFALIARRLDGESDLVQQMRAEIADARDVILRGVEIMSDEQVGKWTGVRTWLEGVESDSEKL